MESKITRETYIRKKLSQEIAELKEKTAELEFTVLLLQEQNEELKKTTENKDKEK